MVSAHTIRAPSARRQRPRRGRSGRGPRLYRVGEFVAVYAIAILANAACLVVAAPLLLLVYPGTGVALSRFIGRRVLWWPYAANIEHVAAAKLHLVVTWPLSIPVFIVKLFIAKFL